MENYAERLIDAAREASRKAYAPYSGFQVGAAVLLDDDTVVCGNNQENRVYPLGSCAERVAINYARAHSPERTIRAIALFSPQSLAPVTPCGGCREVIREAEIAQKFDIEIVMAGVYGQVLTVRSAAELLPCSFDLPDL